MAQKIQITRTAIVERNWACERCGAFGVVVVRAIGSSGWRRVGWIDDDVVERQAREDASMAVERDGDRITAMVRCPTCREQAPQASFWSTVRMSIGVVGGILLAGVIGGFAVMVSPLPVWAAPVLTPLGGWIGGADERRRRREARGIVVTHLVKGETSLPVARALPRPSQPPPPRLEPLRTTAPEQIAPADDAEGPRFLKGE